MTRISQKFFESISLRYSSTYKSYRVFDKKYLVIEESIRIIFCEFSQTQKIFELRKLNLNDDSIPQSNLDTSIFEKTLPKELMYIDAHLIKLIIRNISKYVHTCSSFNIFV